MMATVIPRSMVLALAILLGSALAGTSGQDSGGLLPAAEAPPELSSMEAQKLARAVKALRNSNLKKRQDAEADVLAFGRGALPQLMEAATTDHAGKMAGIQRCLVELVDLRDRELVAQALGSELVVLRRFGAQASGRLGLEPLLAAVPPLLSDEDADVVVLAALSLAAHGNEDGLPVLVDIWMMAQAGDESAARWLDSIRQALVGLRGAGGHGPLKAKLQRAPDAEQADPKGAAAVRIAAVQMLAELGDETAVRALAQGLEDPHNQVQRATIDALRKLLEDGEPFEGATFQQIKELERLRELLRVWRGFPEGSGRG